MKTRLMLASFVVVSTAAVAAQKHAYSVSGEFVEGCSCAPPCACQLMTLEAGCQGVGGYSFTKGSYMGTSLAGVKIAYATEPTKWVRLFIQAKPGAQRKAAEAFARATYAGFGPIESVKDGKITLTGKNGTHTLTVDGGRVMSLSTKPILGADKKTAFKYSNINDPIHSSVLQGRTIKGSYDDGEHTFTLSDSNAYFTKIASKGKV